VNILADHILIYNLRFPNLIAKLARKQLVQRVTGSGTPYLTVHRSLQLNVRHTLSQNKTKRQEIFAQAVALLRKAFPAQHVTQTPSNESWSNYEEYQPHVLSLKAIFELTSPPLSAPPDFAMLLNDAANYFWELGFYRSSQEMASLAVSIFEKLPQPNLMDLASAYAIWGEAAAEEGIIGRDVWLRCSTKAIELRKEFLLSTPNRGTKDERLLFANSYNDFGAYLLHVGNYGQAEKYLDHALAIKALVATEDTESQMFAEGYQNLAVVYAARGDHAMAKKFITKAVELGTKANGLTAATTWTYNFDWANLALARDDYGGALSRHQQVLERRTGIFGEYNCRTRDSYHAVAVAYQGLGQYEEAEYAYLAELPYALLIPIEKWSLNLWTIWKNHLGMHLERRGPSICWLRSTGSNTDIAKLRNSKKKQISFEEQFYRSLRIGLLRIHRIRWCCMITWSVIERAAHLLVKPVSSLSIQSQSKSTP
jgi:tetratricopeptide (TPR) repeat protein